MAASERPPRAGAPAPEAGRPASPDATAARRFGLAAALLVVVQFLLLLDGARRVGPTYDEHFYVASGVSYLRQGDFALNREHPPLLKLLAGAPLFLFEDVEHPPAGADGFNYPVGFFYGRNAEQLDRNLFAARVPFCLGTAALTWFLYLAAARRFGPRSGFAAAALLALNPNVLAHGRLAALDMGVAVGMFVAAVAFLDALERPTARRTLWAGLTFGLAQAAKFTSLLLVPLFGLLAVVEALRERSPRPLFALARVVLVGLTVFAACYGFEAKSANEAWNQPAYTVSVPGQSPEPERLREAVRREFEAAGVEAARAEQAGASIAQAADADGLARLFAQWLARGADPASAEGATRVLEQLRDAPGELRKRLFELALGAEQVAAETRLAALSALADRTLLAQDGGRLVGEAGLERWRVWFGAEREADWDRELFVSPIFEALTRGIFGDTRPIPLFSALRGIDYQLYHGKYGHGSYYRGETLTPGASFAEGNPHPEYYADVLALKNPLAFLIAVLVSIPLAFVFGPRFAARPWTVRDLLVFLGLPLLAFYLFSTGNALMGVRYVLPVFPFLALLVGRLDRLLPWSGVALAGIAALESLWIHPHQLMYYNVRAGGPTEGPAITVVGDDWGQDVRMVADWYERHREAIEAAGGLYYEPYSVADLEAFGLEHVRPIDGPVEGLVAVHAIHYYREAADYRWLEDYEPFERLGWSVWLYDTRQAPPGGQPVFATQ